MKYGLEVAKLLIMCSTQYVECMIEQHTVC